MSETRDLLIEIGTEELPPKALRKLAAAFKAGISDGLTKADLTFADCQLYASPRRLAIVVKDMLTQQADKTIQRRGPALTAAFTEDGTATKAAEGFARSCGVSVDELETLKTDEGAWLSYNLHEAGQAASELIGDIISTTLDKLPIPKRMRWGDRSEQFVRPVHWVIVLLGNERVDTTIMGLATTQHTRGHRFHAPQEIQVSEAANYEMLLETEGHVIADFARRRDAIRAQIESTASEHNATAVIDEDLLDEVTAMVEWPQAVMGEFERRYLDVPAEALISSMKSHQKYFHLLDEQGHLMPAFITISNIESKDADKVRAGNERVIRPRLSDAEFFWQQDKKQKLDTKLERLKNVIFQKQLGSMHDKISRITDISGVIAKLINTDVQHAERAAQLCKCDLLTEMVAEFPDLQGTMGRYYAQNDNEDDVVAQAIEEHYQPRFAGDDLPTSDVGLCVALADKVDTLIGIFAIGQPPSGEKDPFALRRAALGVLRMLVEKTLPIDLPALLQQSFDLLNGNKLDNNAVNAVYDFILGRMDVYFANQGFQQDEIAAVISLRPASLHDVQQRLKAIAAFRKLPAAESLAAANKRIGNIIKKSKDFQIAAVDTAKLSDAEEKTLSDSTASMAETVMPLIGKGDYSQALTNLADLKNDIDAFFDNVMVNTDDDAIRMNRMNLLNNVQQLFLQIADISKLQQ